MRPVFITLSYAIITGSAMCNAHLKQTTNNMDTVYQLHIYRKTDVAFVDSASQKYQFICVELSRKDGQPIIVPAQSENCDAAVSDENYTVHSCLSSITERPNAVCELFTTDAFDKFKDTVTVSFQCVTTWAVIKNVPIHKVVLPLDSIKYDNHSPLADSAWAIKNKFYSAIPIKHK